MFKEIEKAPQLLEIVNSFRTSRIILTAYELDLFTCLANSELTSFEVAKEKSLDQRATDRLMNALVSIGVLRKSNQHFSNTPFSSNYLSTHGSSYMSGLSHQVHLWKTWSTLTEVIRVGTSIAVEKPINEREQEWLQSFIAAMHARGVPQAKEVADLIDFSSTKRILDVGGGSGVFTFEFIRRSRQASAVIFDLPSVVPITSEYILRADMADTVSTLAGDYIFDPIGTGYDLIFVSAVIHINSPDENISLIKKCCEALNPEGQLIILDHIMNDDRTEPAAGAIFALNMLVGTLHGDTYTEAEIRNWMVGGGLKQVIRKDSKSGINLMFGYK